MLGPFEPYECFKIAILEIRTAVNLEHISSDILKKLPADPMDFVFTLLPSQRQVQIGKSHSSPTSEEVESQ